MATSVDIVANGARTPLGLHAAPAAAAVRAGISALREHPFMTDQVGNLMPGALDADLDPHIMGAERLLLLAEAALRETCSQLERISEPRLRLPVYLSLPELRPGFSHEDAEALRSGVMRFQGLPAELSEVNFFPIGHTAGFVALAVATERMRQGAFDACLVGGVDSYFHPDTMEWLDKNRQLIGAVSRSGFAPGEGAGFCLLMNDQLRRRLGLAALLRVRAVAIGKETKLIKTTAMCLGEGLAATVRQAVTGLRMPDERINAVICDINGERYRGEEWGFVCLRLSGYFDDPTAYISPAEGWGDMGAASAPLFIMLACRSAARGYATGPRTMLWASSERGARGVAVLETIQNAN